MAQRHVLVRGGTRSGRFVQLPVTRLDAACSSRNPSSGRCRTHTARTEAPREAAAARAWSRAARADGLGDEIAVEVVERAMRWPAAWSSVSHRILMSGRPSIARRPRGFVRPGERRPPGASVPCFRSCGACSSGVGESAPASLCAAVRAVHRVPSHRRPPSLRLDAAPAPPEPHWMTTRCSSPGPSLGPLRGAPRIPRLSPRVPVRAWKPPCRAPRSVVGDAATGAGEWWITAWAIGPMRVPRGTCGYSGRRPRDPRRRAMLSTCGSLLTEGGVPSRWIDR